MLKKKTTRGSRSKLRPTLGPLVCQWIEAFLVHAEGDFLGQPFRLTSWEKALTYRAYELEKDGSRAYDRVLLGLPKGSGKTEWAAAIGDAELAGPVVFDGWNADGSPRGVARTSPDIPIGAASYDQANLVFGAARTMIEKGPLAPYFTCLEKEIQAKGQKGRMYRVAAEAGTNDGGKPTFFIADELHEWLGRKERVHTVISNNRAKRKGAWELNITTAGFDQNSLLYRMYDKAKKQPKPRDLFVWFEADDSWDLTDRKEREGAVRQCNPAVDEPYYNLQRVLDRYDEIEEYEWRRYYTNQWTSAPTRYIDVKYWDGAASSKKVAPTTTIALGFDGSYNRDSTALVGCTLDDPHLFILGCWEKPEGDDRWVVPKHEVELAIHEALETYHVVRVTVDDTFGHTWSLFLEDLQAKGVEVVEFPTRSQPRIAPASDQFKAGLRSKELTHDGDERLTRHSKNAVSKQTRFGVVPTKDYPDSKKWIDLLIAAIIAYDAALRTGPEVPMRYETEGIRFV